MRPRRRRSSAARRSLRASSSGSGLGKAGSGGGGGGEGERKSEPMENLGYSAYIHIIGHRSYVRSGAAVKVIFLFCSHGARALAWPQPVRPLGYGSAAADRLRER